MPSLNTLRKKFEDKLNNIDRDDSNDWNWEVDKEKLIKDLEDMDIRTLLLLRENIENIVLTIDETLVEKV